MTPPGSPCSIHFGRGITKAAPGSAQNLYLVVSDMESARADLIGHGAAVSGAFHFAGFGEPPVPGPDPSGRSYGTYASFSDPDGNTWLLQEIKSRLPGRGLSNLDVESLTELLRQAEQGHGKYEPTAPKHHWSGGTPPTSLRGSARRVQTRRSKRRRCTSKVRSPRRRKGGACVAGDQRHFRRGAAILENARFEKCSAKSPIATVRRCGANLRDRSLFSMKLRL